MLPSHLDANLPFPSPLLTTDFTAPACKRFLRRHRSRLTPETADNPAEFQHTILLHLPGVAGELSIDRDLIRGLKAGGYSGQTEIYDWTESDPGLSALWSRRRNDKEAQRIADKIIQIVKDDPASRIVITAHSGGTGLAVWALEKLPQDLHVQTLILLSSALSPGYDLTKACGTCAICLCVQQ